MRNALPVLLWVSFAIACTTTATMRRPWPDRELAELNDRVRDQEVEIRLAGPCSAEPPANEEREVVAYGIALSLKASQIEWSDAASGKRSAPADALRSVQYASPDSRSNGALQGAGLGILIGALTGALIGLASGDDQCSGGGFFGCMVKFSAGQKAQMGAIGLGVLGGVSGAIIGAIRGHRDEVEFGLPNDRGPSLYGCRNPETRSRNWLLPSGARMSRVETSTVSTSSLYLPAATCGNVR
jgi:hypothetical protein